MTKCCFFKKVVNDRIKIIHIHNFTLLSLFVYVKYTICTVTKSYSFTQGSHASGKTKITFKNREYSGKSKITFLNLEYSGKIHKFDNYRDKTWQT